MQTSELLRKVRRIEIRTSHLVSDVLAGQFRSAFKGRGMEFEEVRPYQYGDDVRSIDWNVSARTGFPHVKLFREERELTVMLAVDLSGSLGFGTHAQLKRELAAEVAATVAFSAIRSNDRVGLICFTDRVERVVPPRKGSRHVLRIVRDLLAFEPARRGTDIGAAIAEADRLLSRRAVLFVVSDWQSRGLAPSGAEPWEEALRVARARHDVIPVVVRDRRERELPAVGLVEFEDEETGERVVADLGSRAVRERFSRLAAADAQLLDDTLRRLRCEAIRIETGGDIAEPMRAFFHRRGARRAR
ncbi:MAG: DUF58 domain-containing protein [Phycisphaerales bacterium]|nr:DUF58 domain-containing protein [Phycisphaerales bacterium]